MKNTRDGWHKVYGFEVYTEGGKIIRGLSSDHQRTVYPYRHSKDDGWDLDTSMTLDAFRAGVNRGTADMF